MRITRIFKNEEKGAGIILAIIATLVLTLIAGTFAMLVQNEARSAARGAAREQALYVAESGIEKVLFYRSMVSMNMCFPFVSLIGKPGYDGSYEQTLYNDGLPEGKLNPAANSNNCFEQSGIDVDLADGDEDYFECWPYNEALYEGVLTIPPHECNDGSDSTNCPDYNPLAWWPKDDTMPGSVGWMAMDESVGAPLTVNDSDTEGGSQRFTTGFFTTCNDAFNSGEDYTNPPGSDIVCSDPPPAGGCARRVMFFSLVSVGEVVTKDNETMRRAVKVDITPAALYSGVVDQYVDLTMMMSANINGPIHINGWWNNNRWYAFFAFFSASLVPVYSLFDPPDMISVSFPEDPANPDWQPCFPLIGCLANITYVHLPVRIDIPDVNWDKWLDRMRDLYGDFANLGGKQVHLLKMDDYDPANMYNTAGDGSVEYPCTGAQQDECTDNEEWFVWDCPPNTQPLGAKNPRIHNCRSTGYALWGDPNDTYFDLYDNNTGAEVNSASAGGIPPTPSDMTSASHINKSLRYVWKQIIDPSIDNPGCSFTDISACLVRDELRPQFQFMGYHEYRGKVFIDGTMGLGIRTPYHTCGTGDGFPWCVTIPAIGPLPSWSFGIPHWHIGRAKIVGEVVFNGRIYMADYINIAGGAVYADEDIIKDETSGMDVTIDFSALLCWIFTGGAGSLLCDAIMFILNPLMQFIFPWWPTIDLTNNGLIDFEAYLDIDGGNLMNVINSGSLFTRGSFLYEEPSFDLALFALNTIIGMFLPFLELQPAIDPIRVYNFGSIVAAGKNQGGVWSGGDIILEDHDRMDFMTCDPTGDGICDSASEASTGYGIARGTFQVGSDIMSHYGGWGLLESCTVFSLGGLDEDCAAAGIFYSGGVVEMGMTQGKRKQFTSEGCLSLEEDIMEYPCWLGAVLNWDVSEFNIRGHVFAGKVGGMPAVELRLDQDPSVRNEAITRRYFEQLSGLPTDWMEIDSPANLYKLADMVP